MADEETQVPAESQEEETAPPEPKDVDPKTLVGGKVPEDDPGDADPMMSMYDRLPAWIKGVDGENHDSHVRPVGDGDDEAEPDTLDDGFGYTPPDPGSFTADS